MKNLEVKDFCDIFSKYLDFTKNMNDEIEELKKNVINLKKEIDLLKETKADSLEYKEFLEFKEFLKTRK
jgi:hypothetical protein